MSNINKMLIFKCRLCTRVMEKWLWSGL